MAGIAHVDGIEVVSPGPSVKTIIDKAGINQRNPRSKPTQQFLCFSEATNDDMSCSVLIFGSGFVSDQIPLQFSGLEVQLVLPLLLRDARHHPHHSTAATG